MITYNFKDLPSYVFGIPFFDKTKTYNRLPESIMQSLGRLRVLGVRTPGARIGFRTDATKFTVRIKLKRMRVDIGMSIFSCQSISVMLGDRQSSRFLGLCNPTSYDQVEFEREFYKSDTLEEVTLWLPRNEEIEDVWVSIPDGAQLLPPTPYKHGKAIFYGSSITEGGCSSGITNNYVALLSRWLDLDFYNFGFSANCRGDLELADYFSSIDGISLFVYDYDHNAPTVDFLRQTHEPFFKKLRENHPDMPILMLTRPNFYDFDTSRERREVVKETYLNAKAAGDENVYFIDGETFFGDKDRALCTVDCTHPNDLGFYRMASVIYPVVLEILENGV